MTWRQIEGYGRRRQTRKQWGRSRGNVELWLAIQNSSNAFIFALNRFLRFINNLIWACFKIGVDSLKKPKHVHIFFPYFLIEITSNHIDEARAAYNEQEISKRPEILKRYLHYLPICNKVNNLISYKYKIFRSRQPDISVKYGGYKISINFTDTFCLRLEVGFCLDILNTVDS